MSEQQLPIQTLISSRCNELGLRAVEVVRRCGYKNVSKGLRRLAEVSQGYFKDNDALIHALPSALEVAADAVKRAIEETQRQLLEAQEAAWRAAFKPHAVILTERKRPEPMFVAAFIGVERLLRVDLDPTEAPVSYIEQALTGIRQKLTRWDSAMLPGYGRPVGVIVNYTPDRAIRFNLDGNAVEILDRAYRLGVVQLCLGGRPTSQAELDAIFASRSAAK